MVSVDNCHHKNLPAISPLVHVGSPPRIRSLTKSLPIKVLGSPQRLSPSRMRSLPQRQGSPLLSLFILTSSSLWNFSTKKGVYSSPVHGLTRPSSAIKDIYHGYRILRQSRAGDLHRDARPPTGMVSATHKRGTSCQGQTIVTEVSEMTNQGTRNRKRGIVLGMDF